MLRGFGSSGAEREDSSERGVVVRKSRESSIAAAGVAAAAAAGRGRDRCVRLVCALRRGLRATEFAAQPVVSVTAAESGGRDDTNDAAGAPAWAAVTSAPPPAKTADVADAEADAAADADADAAAAAITAAAAAASAASACCLAFERGAVAPAALVVLPLACSPRLRACAAAPGVGRDLGALRVCCAG